ncbi:MAG TPA: response regulator [bacterium]|nr:response regulator [bacterium]
MTDQTAILIVEDERIVAENLREVLIQLGFRVTGIVSTSQDAVNAAGTQHPDLVLMDIKLKGEVDGIEAARQITERFQIPVIYLTAHTDVMTLEKAKTTGPFGYLVKPFHERELKSSIEVALYKHGMEMRLKESEMRYRGLFETMNQGVCTLDAQLLIQSVNPAAETILEAPAHQLIGMNILDTSWETVNEDEKPCSRKDHPAESAMKGKSEGNRIVGIRSRKGNKKWLLINAAVISRHPSDPETVLLTFSDITRNRQLELSMRKQNEQLAAMNRMTGILSSTLNSSELVKKALKEVVKMSDCEAGSLVLLNHAHQVESLYFEGLGAADRDSLDAWHREPEGRYRELLRKRNISIVEMSEAYFSYAMVIPFQLDRKKGALNLFSQDKCFSDDTIHLYSSIGQRIQLTLNNARLYEETRSALRQLKETQDRLIRSEKLAGLGALAGNVVHELGNSLGAISNSIQVLRNRLDLEGPLNELMDIIATESRRLNQCVEQLREFARPRQIRKQPGDFCQMVRHAAAVIQQDTDLIRSRSIDLDLPEHMEAVSFDRDAMEQVMLNLIRNALQAVPENETIRIRVRENTGGKRKCICEVRDQGTGIPPKHIENLFEPYFTTKSRGMGLGLHIVKQIVEGHGGRIQIKSRENRGTTVILTFPKERD